MNKCNASINPRDLRKRGGLGKKKRDAQGIVLIHEIDVADHTFMKDEKTPLRTILPVELQVAKWVRLVKRVRIVPLPMPRRYGLLIEGCGFLRMLDSETLHPAGIHRPVPASISQPRAFISKEHARAFVDSFGLGRLLS